MAIQTAKAGQGKKGVMLMNRIGPSNSKLYIANADGSGERELLAESGFDYHASFSADGEWITFTSERNGDGQSDVFRCRIDGSDLQPLVETPFVEDACVLSPDGRKLAYVSTADGYQANIWVLDLDTGERRKLTGLPGEDVDPNTPDCSFRPSWSPDGAWIAFSSDRDTAWFGHSDGHGWEHTQELSVYVMRADGSDLRKLISKPGWSYGSPKWSPDGSRIICYEIEREHTWGARRPEWIGRVLSQIISVDAATGQDRIEHTSGPDLKLSPQFLPNGRDVAYYIKAGGGGPGIRATDAAWVQKEAPTGLHYTSGAPSVLRQLRSPCWSPDGMKVVYEKVDFSFRAQDKPLFSWDSEWEYRSTDVFPVLSNQGRLAITQKQLGNSSIVTMKPDGTDQKIVFDAAKAGLDPLLNKKGIAGAFQPAWSPDGEWIAFGCGNWFQYRTDGNKAVLMRAKADGSFHEALTDGTVHSGFPSYLGDGSGIVYRVWGDGHFGLRIIDLETRAIRVLTTERDNLPFVSPDGELITFTRQFGPANYHVCTIRPDGSDFKVLTETGANDGHSIWTYDGKIAYSSGMYGFRDEAGIYDFTFQPYGQIMVMDADGSNKRLVTDSLWEDSMPLYIPSKFL
ncbi:PD40 domain-containing protein [Nitrospirillum iridis]|uniref:Tol biopolymer transport system component n=1 Tax=Nitrospirillum iridis TaxID=765888 RepID=A0A7X0B3V6_9PROT|nr:PD40 domain-containing protein [Nitrospirillum iridis]MBB6255262.1 Tol biopolymer transport system component [Nitrospirillum iridis]